MNNNTPDPLQQAAYDFAHSNYEGYVSEDGRTLIDIPGIFLHGFEWAREHLPTPAPLDEEFSYCQREIEEQEMCATQCDHCKAYYKPLEDENKLQQEAEAYASTIYPDHLFTLKKPWEQLVECYKVAARKYTADKKQVEWISVKERLPEAGKRVLCLPKGYPFRMICEQYWEAYADQNDAWFKETFLYWQPLPEKPKI